MADIQTQLPVKLTDGINTVGITGSSLSIDLSSTGANTTPIVVSGSVTSTGTSTVAYGSGTFPVSGTVIADAGAGTFTTSPAPDAVHTVAGTVTADAGAGTFTVAHAGGTFPISGTVTAVTDPVATQTVAGTVTADAGAGTFTTSPVPGAVHTVGGTVIADAGAGTFTVAHAGGTFPVSGTVTALVDNTATQTVAGTVSTLPLEVAGGVIVSHGRMVNVASGADGVHSYTVTAGMTFYLKEVIAASSGGPCRVQVDYGVANPVVLAVGFYSTANPTLQITFAQPIPIMAGMPVNVRVTNNLDVMMDTYATVLGHEV